MFSRRHVLGAFVLAAAIAVAPYADAMTPKAFDQKAFEAAQAAGKPILVEVHAPWCPTCKAQQPILDNLTAKPAFRNFVTFRIDFDSQKDLLRKLNVRSQSTLIVFKGKTEAGRSTGDTNPASIEALLAKAI